MSGGFTHRPALDGVRAFAVAAVLVFHGGLTWLPGGFFGVDAFFVLSGFLITSLLLTEVAGTGRIRLPAFWGRRARRLLPALLLMVAVVVPASRWLLPPGDMAPVRGDAIAALLYVANWRMIFRGSDYFAQTATPSPLQHTWSLGIEEQFYLVWPLVMVAILIGVTRRHADPLRRRWLLLAACAGGGIVSTVLADVLYRATDSSRAYYGTDTRAVALLVGCGLAIILYRRLAGGRHRADERHPVLGALTVLAVAGLAWGTTHATGATNWQYHLGFAAIAVAVAVVIAHAVVSPGSPTAWVLSRPPVVALGKISYGVYLWHWPVFVLLTAERAGFGGLGLFALRCAVTLAVSTASYFLVELPIRRGRLFHRGSRLAPAGVLTGMAAVAAVTLVATANTALPTAPAQAAQNRDARPVVVRSASPAPVAPVHRKGRKPGTEPRIDIFGDSVSWTLGTYLPPHPGLTVNVHSLEGCGIATLPDILELGSPHTNYPGCTNWPNRWRGGVTDDPDVSVILLDRWELMDRRLAGKYQHVGQPGYDAYLTKQLDLAVGIAGSHGARVVLLTAPYTHRAEQPDGSLYPEDQPGRVDAWNRLLRSVAGQKHATVLDLNHLVCPNGRFTWTVDGLQVRSDGLHFTPAGVQQVIAPWLLPQLAAIANGTGN
ncbi:acyltransferase family protein [Actinocatenispora rupis]|uniref:Membrane protein n=1 Tax=Actinocatenispora rupis TaxID=519421 RepID=A0A8J3J1P5_9ACTN|nr:acyltransferase family protein [Actinocatenispora rupis]GID10382.1 membrane protein [Actinocatenispora rupis]